ncbi:MAG: iron-containing alcohol dehydrogenase [Bacilli bacterium]|nr:iron-containing alcohol dehydrogenase [Bacilli bacterium]
MKAFIFNSGSGSRMGDLTKSNPKALVKLANDEAILSRQIRLLKSCGINEIIISTGPFEDQIKDLTKKFNKLKFSFIRNDKYNETNSIYSMYLAKDFIKEDDFIILHGDLVFDQKILEKLIFSKSRNVCLINKKIDLPEKDFKGKIVNEKLKKISVSIFDKDCFALQPLYKFDSKTLELWHNEIEKFIKKDEVKVYAENALNNILDIVDVSYLDYDGNYVEEIDNQDDLKRVNVCFRLFDYANQEIITSSDYLGEINKYIISESLKNPLIVHGKHLLKDDKFKIFCSNYTCFSNYSPNPKYEEIIEGLDVFKKYNCDSIVAIGGGSCIDVAKGIKIFSPMKNSDYINQVFDYVELPLLAVPTTAGTGTESTRYSVIYYNKEKQSLTHDSILPNACILNSDFLIDLPVYQKKSTLLDAFCQAVESYWSVNSNEESKVYAKEAIELFLNNYKEYIKNNHCTYPSVMLLSNLAGRAINITQTTAPHAMSYKLTTLYNIAHGHAVSLGLPKVLEYIINNIDKIQDIRGKVYLANSLDELVNIFKVKDKLDLIKAIEIIINEFNLETPKATKEEIEILASSVDVNRLKNNPVILSKEVLKEMYQSIFNI